MMAAVVEGDLIIPDFALSFSVVKPNGRVVAVNRRGEVVAPSPYSPALAQCGSDGEQVGLLRRLRENAVRSWFEIDVWRCWTLVIDPDSGRCLRGRGGVTSGVPSGRGNRAAPR